MKSNQNSTTSSPLDLSDFVETDAIKQAEMEEMLRDSKLEDVMSPFYLIFNASASIVGF